MRINIKEKMQGWKQRSERRQDAALWSLKMEQGAMGQASVHPLEARKAGVQILL